MVKNRIKEFREGLGLTQVELARKVRMASTNLSAIENGRLVAWPKVKKRLTKALNCTVTDLFPEDFNK